MEKDFEKLCPRYNRELYKHFNIYIKPQERLNFPTHVSPVNFVYNREKNYSHSIAFEDGSTGENENVSESKVKYQIPNSSLIREKDGARKRLLEKFLWRQMTQEMIDEIVDKNEVENYCTEYDNHYYKDGFDPSESHGPNEENHAKYPIYGTGSNALTIYSFGKHNGKNILHPFKRQSGLTTPINDRLIDSEWKAK